MNIVRLTVVYSHLCQKLVFQVFHEGQPAQSLTYGALIPVVCSVAES